MEEIGRFRMVLGPFLRALAIVLVVVVVVVTDAREG